MDFKFELIPLAVQDIDEQPWGRFVRFDDPDGNRWALQIIVPS